MKPALTTEWDRWVLRMRRIASLAWLGTVTVRAEWRRELEHHESKWTGTQR